MEILKAIISSIREDSRVKMAIKGPLWIAIASRVCGLANSMPDSLQACQEGGEKEEAGFLPLVGKSGLELAQLSLSERIDEASIGLAAINSLIGIEDEAIVPVNASDILMDTGRGKNIAIIGHFPFIEDLKKVAGNLWVIEKRPRPGDYPEDMASLYLPQSDVIAISSTTLINHTLPYILKFCPPNSIKMLLGPTTPMSNTLFDYGIDIISGTRVIDEEALIRLIMKGVNFRQIKASGAVELVTMVRDRAITGRR